MMRFVILLLTGLVVGCSSGVKRFYDGPARPSSQVAKIRDTPHVGTTGVDGKRFNWWGEHVVEVEPGVRVVSVSLMGHMYSPDDYILRFNAQAGHEYELLPYLQDKQWRPVLVDRGSRQETPYERVSKDQWKAMK